MWKEEGDRRGNKQYNYKQDKTVKFIYERAASWDEERRKGGGGMISSNDSWTEFWIKQIELVVHILVHKTTNNWNQFLFSWLDSPKWARASSVSRLHDHTQSHNTR